ncbi:MAG TPA: DUF5106 domain-containing protein [Edaphocola sp.]|nr:DUF5106 domain-containing protein [Edaphocola sp.]
MKRLLLGAVMGLFALNSFGQKEFGYKVEVTFKQPIKDKKVYLAHYFGKGLPTIYKLDSAVVENGGTKAVFQKKDSILGGLHLVMFDNYSRFFHLLLDNGYTIRVETDTLGRAHFFENKINQDFEEEEHKLVALQKPKDKWRKAYDNAKTKSDSSKAEKQYQALLQQEKDLKRAYAASHPGNLLTLIFNAMDSPDLPKKKHFLPNGKEDTMYTARYYKDHYWEKFDFTDNRLIKTGLLDNRLNEYFSNLVYPIPDSINYEMDKMLAKAESAKEIYKYILHWLGNWTVNSKMMGVDASFVYLVENYYGKGKAFWLDSAAIAKYQERAEQIAPNVLGNKAPKLVMQDISTLKDVEITEATHSPYTVLVFWSITCGHCMTEMPKIAEMYRTDLKKMGVEVISVPVTVDGGNDIRKVYDEWKVTDDWITLVDLKNTREYLHLYDAYSTPVIYVLDKDKIIVGKKLAASSIIPIIEYDMEHKNRKKKN